MTRMNASEFKARCLAILDEVCRTGEPLTILKRGRPVAVVGPPLAEAEAYPQHALVGSVRIIGEVVEEPAVLPEDWEAESADGP